MKLLNYLYIHWTLYFIIIILFQNQIRKELLLSIKDLQVPGSEQSGALQNKSNIVSTFFTLELILGLPIPHIYVYVQNFSLIWDLLKK